MKTKKILLIDDDCDFIAAISNTLISHGFETELACNADEGYQKAIDFKPDLIILDVHMGTDNAGFDLCKKLWTVNEFRSVPVIMLSGIDITSVSDQIVELYRQINSTPGFETNTVLKGRNADGSISVDYKNESGCNYFRPYSFMSKPVDIAALLLEVNRFLKE